MNWRRAPLLLTAWLVSLGLLLVFVLVLIPGHKTARLPLAPLVIESKKPEATLPPDFGRLAEQVPFAGGIAPVSAEVQAMAAEPHEPEFRDSAWLRAQPSEAYTLQVMAARDEEAVRRFLAGRDDRSQFDYFLHTQDGNNWFVVTSGRYPSLELARGMAETRDFGLPSRPFPKIIQAYQAALPPSP